MKSMSSSNPLSIVFAVAVVFLSALLLFEVIVLAIVPRLSLSEADDVLRDGDRSLKAIDTMPPIDDFQEAIDRSLFSWNRKPISAERQSVDEGGLSSRWVLSGVVNTGEAIYAIFASNSSDQRLRLEEGMYLEKWKITEISPETVALRDGSDEEVFRLREVDLEISPRNATRPRRDRDDNTTPDK